MKREYTAEVLEVLDDQIFVAYRQVDMPTIKLSVPLGDTDPTPEEVEAAIVEQAEHAKRQWAKARAKLARRGRAATLKHLERVTISRTYDDEPAKERVNVVDV